jgi:hypothetical protein
MAMGRPKGPPSRPLNVRIETADLDKLALINSVTGKSAADVVRDAIKLYVKLHDRQLKEAESRIAGREPTRDSSWYLTREELEAAEDAAKSENHYGSKEEWDNN